MAEIEETHFLNKCMNNRKADWVPWQLEGIAGLKKIICFEVMQDWNLFVDREKELESKTL